MKNYKFVRCLAASVALFAATAAHATVVTNALWTFEVSVPSTSGPHSPEVGSGQATQVGGATFTNPLGNGSLESFAANQWNTGEYFQFQVSTLGFHSIKLEWDQGRSTAGPDDFILQYSTDGISFTDHNSYVVLNENGNWNSVTRLASFTFNYNLTAITALNNQPTVFFRLTTTDNPGGTGTVRVDNFLVTSSIIPEPSTVLLLGVGGALVWRRARSRK